MKTQSQNTQTKSKGIRIRFIEYDSWKPGQHFMTAVSKSADKKQTVIARIYMERNPETKQVKYIVKDADGKEVSSGDNLFKLKQEIKTNARELAQHPEQLPEQNVATKTQEKNAEKKIEKQPEKKQPEQQNPPQQEVSEREEELNSIREQNQEHSQEKGIDR